MPSSQNPLASQVFDFLQKLADHPEFNEQLGNMSQARKNAESRELTHKELLNYQKLMGHLEACELPDTLTATFQNLQAIIKQPLVSTIKPSHRLG